MSRPRAAPPLRLAIALVAVLPTGCGRGARPDASANLDIDQGVAEQRYLAPPQALRATNSHDGGVVIAGRAEPMGEVALSSPEGERYTAVADRRGRWTLRLPPAPAPRLYALSSQADGRAVHAQGAVVTAPHAGYAAVLVRAGYPALPLGGDVRAAVVSMDYDPGGFVGVSGKAEPGARVRLGIDGVAAGATQADAQGRFALLAANRRLGPGPHAVAADTPAGIARATFHLTPSSSLAAPYAAERASGGWRVEWALNGGGVQTTLLAASG